MDSTKSSDNLCDDPISTEVEMTEALDLTCAYNENGRNTLPHSQKRSPRVITYRVIDIETMINDNEGKGDKKHNKSDSLVNKLNSPDVASDKTTRFHMKQTEELDLGDENTIVDNWIEEDDNDDYNVDDNSHESDEFEATESLKDDTTVITTSVQEHTEVTEHEMDDDSDGTIGSRDDAPDSESSEHPKQHPTDLETMIIVLGENAKKSKKKGSKRKITTVKSKNVKSKNVKKIRKQPTKSEKKEEKSPKKERRKQEDAGKKKYRCTVCGLCVRSWRNLGRHFSRLHEMKEFDEDDLDKYKLKPGESELNICTLCDFTSSDASNFRMHSRKHVGLRPHLCKICGYSAALMSTLKAHERMHSGEKPFKCSHCPYATSHSSGYYKHVKTLDTDAPDDQKCESCQMSFKGKNCLSYHIRQEHTDHDTEQDSIFRNGFMTKNSPFRSLPNSADTIHRLFTCPECGRSFRSIHKVKRHMLIHSDERPFSCDHCDYRAKSKNRIKLHMVTHESVRRYQCDQCAYASSTKNVLQVHIRTQHTNEKPFICEFCEYATGDPTKLTRHRKVHTGERPHKCPYPNCGYGAIQKKHLQAHISKHTGIKEYRCSQCQFETSLLDALRTHEKIHNYSTFACHHCLFITHSQLSLNLHTKHKHPEADMLPKTEDSDDQ